MNVLLLFILGLKALSCSAFAPYSSFYSTTTTNTGTPTTTLSLYQQQQTHKPQYQSPRQTSINNNATNQPTTSKTNTITNTIAAFTLLLTLTTTITINPLTAYAATSAELGASAAANTKITTGGASTLQSGRTIAITRGVNLDRSDFSNQDLKGVAFQQSIVRDCDFTNSNLIGSSFFDATVDGSNFENADMSLANVEMAQFNRSILKNAIMREMYVSGSTLFEGVKDIEGSDWSDTFLRKDQQKYLCNHPTAKGTNPKVREQPHVLCFEGWNPRARLLEPLPIPPPVYPVSYGTRRYLLHALLSDINVL